MPDWLHSIIGIIGGLGLGTFISTFFQERRNERRFLYEQKLSTYSGYLESLSASISNGSFETKQKVVYWTTRLKLIAPLSICKTAMKFFDKESKEYDFNKYREEIINAMAEDLKKSL